MKMLTMGALLLMVGAWCSSDAFALCGGGGRSGGGRVGVRSGGQPAGKRGSVVTGGLGARGTGGDGQSSCGQTAQKFPLPAAVEIASLDTRKFDAVVSGLNLSAEQTERVDALKRSIRAEAEKLVKEQSSARLTYERTACPVACQTIARDVVEAAGACRSFDPNRKFVAGLKTILDATQFGAFRELASRV
ncbi:MAG: hypothetical protein AMXMBFR7_35820 [Planctomycetota bacterium]